MQKAIEVETGRCVKAFDADRESTFYCPNCFADVHLRPGMVKEAHFAHNPNTTEDGECPDYHENDGQGYGDHGPYERLNMLNRRAALRISMTQKNPGRLEAILPQVSRDRASVLRGRKIHLVVGDERVHALPAERMLQDELGRTVQLPLLPGLVNFELDGKPQNDSPDMAELRRSFDLPLLALRTDGLYIFSTSDGVWLDPGEALHGDEDYYVMAGPARSAPVPEIGTVEPTIQYDLIPAAGGWRVWRVQIPASVTESVRAWGRRSLRRLITTPRGMIRSDRTSIPFFEIPPPVVEQAAGALTINPPLASPPQSPCRLVWDLPWKDVRASFKTESGRRVVQIWGARDRSRETTYRTPWFCGVDTLGWKDAPHFIEPPMTSGSVWIPRVRTVSFTTAQLQQRLRVDQPSLLARISASWLDVEIVVDGKAPPLGSEVFLKAA